MLRVRHVAAMLAVAAVPFLTVPAMAQSQSQTTGVAATAVSPANLTQAQIVQIQQKLEQAGVYHGSASGAWDTDTQAALRQYQQAKNLPATGTLDAQTMAALGVTNTNTGVGTAGQTGGQSR